MQGTKLYIKEYYNILKKESIKKERKEIKECFICHSLNVHKEINNYVKNKGIKKESICKLCYIDLLGGKDM